MCSFPERRSKRYEYDDDPLSEWDKRITYYDTVDEYTMMMDGRARTEWKYYHGASDEKDEDERYVLNPDQVERERYFDSNMELVQIKAGYGFSVRLALPLENL